MQKLNAEKVGPFVERNAARERDKLIREIIYFIQKNEIINHRKAQTKPAKLSAPHNKTAKRQKQNTPRVAETCINCSFNWQATQLFDRRHARI